MADSIRSFLAIQPTPDVRRRLADEQAEIKVKGARLRPVAEQNLHLTIEFLGCLPADTIPVLADVMDQAGSMFSPFELELIGISAFPSRRPVVLAAELAESGNLDNLVADIKQRLSNAGFKPEARPFRPHITLARIKSGHQYARALSRPIIDTFDVKEVVLFRSDLSPDGARYSRMYETKLRG